jgi:hypothetical protein
MPRLSKVEAFILADHLLASDDEEDDAALDELLKPCPMNLSQCTASSNEARSEDEQSPPSRQKKMKKEETHEQMEARGSSALILPSLARYGGAVISHLTRRP